MSFSLMPNVPASALMNDLLDRLKIQYPVIQSRFWKVVKRSDYLDNAHFLASEGDCEASYKDLLDALIGVIKDSLSENAFKEMMYENQMFKVHCEVAQASILEPHEEALVWDAWERQDEQANIQAEYDMYYNEY